MLKFKLEKSKLLKLKKFTKFYCMESKMFEEGQTLFCIFKLINIDSTEMS